MSGFFSREAEEALRREMEARERYTQTAPGYRTAARGRPDHRDSLRRPPAIRVDASTYGMSPVTRVPYQPPSTAYANSYASVQPASQYGINSPASSYGAGSYPVSQSASQYVYQPSSGSPAAYVSPQPQPIMQYMPQTISPSYSHPAETYNSPNQDGRFLQTSSNSSGGWPAQQAYAPNHLPNDLPTPSVYPSPQLSRSSSPADLQSYGYMNADGKTWRCAFPGCTSTSQFARGCDLRKHYWRHNKTFFCRWEGCPKATEGGYSSKKDRTRHEAKHDPGVHCEWADCDRIFSRVDNMKDHVRRIHRKAAHDRRR